MLRRRGNRPKSANLDGAFMRRNVHDTAVRVRLNEALLRRAEQSAVDRGMSVSELVRHAVRRELEAA